jgi:DNA-binding MarR family transcriptional regulator
MKAPVRSAALRRPAGSRAGRAPAPGALRAVPLEDLLTYQVCILAKMMERASAGELGRKHKLGVAEWRVLAQLAVRSPSTVRWLAARMRVDRAEVSRAAAALIARKLARRMPDPDDARSVLFSIAEAGRALHREIMPLRLALHDRLAAVLTVGEARAFATAVRKLTRHLDEMEAAAPKKR